jgi:sec-independent protein translocase protein TatB
MLDIGWTEIAIIVIIAILIIGPKDLPKAMRTVAHMIGKVKGMMREFQNNIDDMIKETELEEVKKQVQSLRHGDLSQTIESTIDKDGSIKKAMDFQEENESFDQSMATVDQKSAPKKDSESDKVSNS